jgi:hypothetical protein
MPEIPPIDTNLPFYDSAYFAQRHRLTPHAIQHHMRNLWGKATQGRTRQLTKDEALRLDSYISLARQKPDKRTGLKKDY